MDFEAGLGVEFERGKLAREMSAIARSLHNKTAMKAFIVPVGTKVKAIRKGVDWTDPQAFQEFATKKEHMFFSEDIVVDPLGHEMISPPPEAPPSLVAVFRRSYYGFQLDNSYGRWAGGVMLVPARQVQVG